MSRLFISLYLIVALSLIGLSAVLSTIFEQDEQQVLPSHQYLVALLKESAKDERTLEALLSASHIPFKYSNINDTAWPDAQLLAFRSGEIVELHDEDRQFVYIPVTSDKLIEVTLPVISTRGVSTYLYSFVFFVLLALVIAVWVQPLWRDLHALQKSVERIQPNETFEKVSLHHNSLVRPIANAFNQLNNKVNSLLQSQKELTGAVAHEFRTPIARLKFALAMSEETQSGMAHAMADDLNELDDLVQEMLDFTSLDAHQPELNITEIPVFALCEKVVAKFIVPDRIKISISGQSCSIFADEHFIERALSNLFANAMRHTEFLIEIVVQQSAQEVIISVRDNGEGIAEEHINRVFEPFHRVDCGRDRRQGGAGLGLAIVSRIMKWHGGNCVVMNHEKKGASFQLTIPAP